MIAKAITSVAKMASGIAFRVTGWDTACRLATIESVNQPKVSQPMRIIAGIMKGRKLLLPRGLHLRPTTDKVKEAIFNILSAEISGASFLDLFSGSGSIGIEAISRGAKRVVFVEKDKKHALLIRKNLSLFPSNNPIAIFEGSAQDFLKTTKELFDLAYIDPPYEDNDLPSLLLTLGSSDTIRPNGIAVIEHFYKREFHPSFGKLIFLRQVRYGGTALSFYVKK
ncbi:MAG: 16S rRNA (guanine(966)-N(2))-methyltransferase RsmD [Nitrospirae bacterium]|nr:16S rRNA (guanine(966)-N(2))-methyltransferase RsmD [Candidatus Troglogloeales bacterium]